MQPPSSYLPAPRGRPHFQPWASGRLRWLHASLLGRPRDALHIRRDLGRLPAMDLDGCRSEPWGRMWVRTDAAAISFEGAGLVQ